MDWLTIQRNIPDIRPVFLFDIFGFPISASTLTTFLIIMIFSVLALIVIRRFKVRPTSFQILFEMVYEGALAMVDEVTNSKRRSKIIFPVIASLFLYLLVANLIGLIPGLMDFTYKGKAILQTTTSDFNTTLGLSLAAIVIINIISIKEWGLLTYLGNFFKFKEVISGFKEGVGAGAISLVDFFVGMLDIVGEIAKVISLSIRLFANMYAGQILTVILMGAFAYVLPTLWYGMGIFSAGLQAMVFAVLVASYYMLAIKPDEEVSTEKAE